MLDFYRAVGHHHAMPSDSDIITQLNAILRNKLAGINQYFLHARMLKHQGYVKLADYEY